MVRTYENEVFKDYPNPVDAEYIEYIDDNVISKMPEGTKYLSIQPWGFSYWSRVAKISTEQTDGSQKSFFLKVTTTKAMVAGEFYSQWILHQVVPDITPEPLAFGMYASEPRISFFLSEFINMDENNLPDLEKFARELAKLHTAPVSPDCRYGFHIPTYQGPIPQFTDWTKTWEEFFSRSFQRVVEQEQEAQGADEELQALVRLTCKKVIPRLLRPLETGGRTIWPCLVHGEIWDGNVATNITTGNPMIFDSTCIYAHNEYDLGSLRPLRHRMKKEYIEAYFKRIPPSEPKADCNDRNILYCLRFDLLCSALFKGTRRWRNLCKTTMRHLASKYPEGYEGWAKERGEELAPGYNDDDNTRPLVSSYASLSGREILQPRPINPAHPRVLELLENHKRVSEWLENSTPE